MQNPEGNHSQPVQTRLLRHPHLVNEGSVTFTIKGVKLQATTERFPLNHQHFLFYPELKYF